MPTLTLDSSLIARQLKEFASSLTNKRHRAMMDTVLRHVIGEIVEFDLDAVMDTLVDNPVYHYFGSGESRTLVGRAAVREMYSAFGQYGPTAAQFDVSQAIVGDGGFMFQGLNTMLGSRALTLFPSLSKGIQADRDFVVTKQVLVVMPFDGDLMTGEDMYFDGPYSAADVHFI